MHPWAIYDRTGRLVFLELRCARAAPHRGGPFVFVDAERTERLVQLEVQAAADDVEGARSSA